MHMDAIPYKAFHIVVTIRPALSTENKFQVVSQIYRNLEETPVMRNWLGVREFASETEAYEFGLREACAWIDEDAHD